MHPSNRKQDALCLLPPFICVNQALSIHFLKAPQFYKTSVKIKEATEKCNKLLAALLIIACFIY
jgi:hypothetical protein